LADEHHQARDGARAYLATTVGGGCCLGVAVAGTAGTDDLTAAYGAFLAEARDVDPDYTPATVNTDGWSGTRAAWAALVPTVVLLRCFLHGWLKVRDRAKNLGQTFFDLSKRVWEAYHAPDKRSFSQRLRRLDEWAGRNVGGVVLEAVSDLCRKRELWLVAYDHPAGHRTSNMLAPRDAAHVPLLHRRPAPARPPHDRTPRPRLGPAVQLRPLEPRHDPGQRPVAMPRRTAEQPPLPRRLAPEPVDLSRASAATETFPEIRDGQGIRTFGLSSSGTSARRG
jgi:hypothetical protein